MKEDEEFGANFEDKNQDGDESSKSEEDLTSEIENRRPRQLEEKEVKVVGVYEYQEEGSPPGYSAPAFVLLRDNQGRQVLIYIGHYEAVAISVALEGVAFDRPMTHDLLKNVLDRTGYKVERILIDDLWQDTYYAKISVAGNGGGNMEIDSRPSDAIALALRTKSPIYMAETVLQQAAMNEEI